MRFTEKEWEKLEQSALKYYQEGFHPDDLVSIEYDERGIAVKLSRPLPEEVDINTSVEEFFFLSDFLPS